MVKPTSIRYASLLIRLWRHESAEGAASAGEWQSEVEHIQTGQCWTFESLNNLLTFLREEAEEERIATTIVNGMR